MVPNGPLIHTGKRLSRRTLLRGLGAAIALPALDSMMPAFAAPRASRAPMRLAFVYVPNGIMMPDWTPASDGPLDALLPRTLEPLGQLRQQVTVITGLTQNGGRALGDGAGDHARAAASYLTGVHPRKTAGADIHNGISADQVAALEIGKATRFASLELACEDGRLVGNCDSGYSCAYSNSISWRSDTTPNPPEVNPRVLFERLFGESEPGLRREWRRSVLDLVADDTRNLQQSLGPADRRKLDEYLTGVREIEARIQAAEKQAAQPRILPEFELPEGVPVEFAEHVHLMFDLMTVAFRADLTRIATFMMCREGSNRTYRELGISDPHHGITHHQNDPDLIAKVARINRYHVELFAQFLAQLANTPDGEGSLLDHSAIVYGSGLSDGNRHLHHDLPILLAGRANGVIQPGRHIRYAKNTPMANLFLSLFDPLGVRASSIGDSTGKLDYLVDLG